MNVVCFFRGHKWSERPYPSKWGDKSWRYDMPYLIDDPLVWNLVYDECERCNAFRWHFRTSADAMRYWLALSPEPTEERGECAYCGREGHAAMSCPIYGPSSAPQPKQRPSVPEEDRLARRLRYRSDIPAPQPEEDRLARRSERILYVCECHELCNHDEARKRSPHPELWTCHVRPHVHLVMPEPTD